MKKKQLNKLGHAMLKSTAMLSAGLMHVYEEIINDEKLTRKEENRLLRSLFESSVDSMHDTATIMSAAENFEGDFKIGSESVHEIASALGVDSDLKICDKCREEMSINNLSKLHEDKNQDAEPKTEEQMVSALDELFKKNGINAEMKVVNGKDLPSALAAILNDIAKTGA